MRKRIILSLAITCFMVLIGCTNENEQVKFQTLLDEEWQRGLKENPIYASYMGDKSANQDWPDISETAVRDRQNKVRNVLEQIKSIDPKRLPEAQQLNYRLFLYNYERAVLAQKFDSHLLVFGQRGGIQLEHETTEGLIFQNGQDYEDWLIRLTKLPDLIAATIELAKLALEQGITAPKILMERVARQIKLQLKDDPKTSPFYNIFESIPDNIDAKLRLDIQQRAQIVIMDQVIPAYEVLDEFFTTKYLPAARETYGISDLPNGREWYEHLARWHTTTDLSPDEIHEIGLSEVSRIRDEMEENYCNGLEVTEGSRYWKITSTNGSGTQRSVSGFIVKAGDKKFLEGDMLKAAGWAAPARNFARGNVLDGYRVDEVRWTGIG